MRKSLISLVICFLFLSCSENLSPDTSGSLTISGNIKNTDSYDDFNRIFCYYNRVPDSVSLIDSYYFQPNGYFNLVIQPPSFSQLRAYSPSNYSGGGIVRIDSISFSNDSILFSQIKFRVSNKADNVRIFVDDVNFMNSHNRNVGDVSISYYYFSESCQITGYFKEEHLYGNTTISKFDLVIKKGWNKIVTTVIINKYKTTYGNFIEYSVSNINKVLSNWIINDYPNYDQRLF